MSFIQSRSVTTMLRSAPWGRGGVANGSSPLAIRSVHSRSSRTPPGPAGSAGRTSAAPIGPTARGVSRPRRQRRTCRGPASGFQVERLAQLMAAHAAGVLHRANPGRLRQPGRNGALAAKLPGIRNIERRDPVDGGVVVRRGGLVGRRAQGVDREALARARPWSWRCPPGRSRVPTPDSWPWAGRRRTNRPRSSVTTLFDVADREVARLRDYPDAGFGTGRTRHHAADVVGVDGDVRRRRPLLRVRDRPGKRKASPTHAAHCEESASPHGPANDLVSCGSLFH